MLAAAGGGGDATDPAASVARREAYRHLMDMRTHRRAALAEPPPSSNEAAAWFPLLAAAERICDHVTAYATRVQSPLSPKDGEALGRLAARVAATPDERNRQLVPSCADCSAALRDLSAKIEGELQHMDRLRDDHAFKAVSAPWHRLRSQERG